METNHLRTPPRRSITSSFAVKTERPCSKLRCGRWDLRATKSRQARGQLSTPRSLFNTPRSKRKRSPQPSVNSSTAENECPYPGAPTSDDEREMDERFHAYSSAKGVVDESCSSGGKRKSSGQGQSSKNPKMDEALQSWQRSCEARERYYAQAEANAGAADAYSVAASEGEGRGEGPSQVQGEVGVPNVHRNEDGVPSTQQHNHVNMSREQILQMGQWRDEVAASMWAAYYNSCLADDLASHLNITRFEDSE
ncbi:hypothetical protein LOK49_LG12G01713 [Camellia lanceoleosa]|uniref:Uncharacterized protein n=1 Tax=Camellia lanceoleosa TaxID=1840588 RepID=A0ACC0FSB6_9ERIC|nr:hypothetical protein LOK49_LG12G01713 [Camellia lanceoleosa]